MGLELSLRMKKKMRKIVQSSNETCIYKNSHENEIMGHVRVCVLYANLFDGRNIKWKMRSG